MGARAVPAPLVHAARHAPGGADALWLPNEIEWQSGEGVGTIRTNFAKNAHAGNGPSPLTSGLMYVYEIVLKAGDVINYLGFRSAAQAVVTPAHWWFALYDNANLTANAALLAQSANQLTTAWAANTAKVLQLGSTVNVATSGRYRAACMVNAATAGSLIGPFVQQGMILGYSWMTGRSNQCTVGSGLTTTAPATLAGFSNNIGNACALVVASQNA